MLLQFGSHVAFVCEIAVLLRLSTGLWRHYPWFTLMTVGGVGQHLALRTFLDSYRDIWIATSPVLILLQIAAAHELYRLWCRHWPGRSGYGSVFAAGIFLGVFALAGFSLTPSPNPVDWIVEIQRDVAYVLALALILTIRFFWIQPHWPFSLRLHTGVLVGWYTLVALAWLLAAVHAEWRTLANGITHWGRAILLLTWAIGMRAEVTPPPPTNRRKAHDLEAAIARDLQVPPPDPEALHG